MSLAKNIREQLIKSFRAELAEHVQTMTDGFLAIEQATGAGQTVEPALLEKTFRAAHSLKGAARAMGVVAIEQLAHALENILDGLRRSQLAPAPVMFSACFHALDTIQVVQSAYEAGETTPPSQALLALAELEKVREELTRLSAEKGPESAPSTAAPVAAEKTGPETPAGRYVAPFISDESAGARPTEVSVHPAAGVETIRVDVQKLDSLMENLSELLAARIRLELRQTQLARLRNMLNNLQWRWSPARGPFNRLLRQQENGLLSLYRPRSVDIFQRGEDGGRQPERPGAPLQAGLADVQKDLVALGKDSAALLRYTSFSQNTLQEINSLVAELNHLYAADMMHLSAVIDDLENAIKRLRMMPFSTITAPFARMVRDLAQQSGKEAVLMLKGGETEMDKQILERIKDPLTHLLRNAVDHGIEPPDVRQARGKPRAGVITLTAEQTGGEVVITLVDDGNGLDMEAIRRAAAQKLDMQRGERDASAMSEVELVDAIFQLGVTTSKVTDISGRGVGLNVVRNNVEALHGRVEVASRPGQGTTFTLVLPLVMTGARALFVKAAGCTFAIPTSNVEHAMYLSPKDVFTLEGQDAIQYRDQPVTLVRLADVLEIPESMQTAAAPGEDLTVVVLSSSGRLMDTETGRDSMRLMAFTVDDLVGEQEIVVKNLGKQITRVMGILGASVMGSGEVVLILNTSDLMKLAARRSRRSIRAHLEERQSEEQQAARKRILVVDDSITTRTLEKNILEAAGYEVEIATDGLEALNLIQSAARPDLVVTDIVMPQMDGFELTRRIKSNPQTESIPVILVTSLDTPEDKKRGIEVQADAYIVKSSFDQENLLETIAQLI